MTMWNFIKELKRKDHQRYLGGLDFFKYIGPGLLVTVGFIDPGNWASNFAAGSDFGYTLLWVVTLSTVMLVVLQHNVAHLGIVTGLCLSEAATRYAPRWVARPILGSAVLASISTSLAEILGGAIALEMLLGVPVVWGSVLTAALVVVLLFTNSYKASAFDRLQKFCRVYKSLYCYYRYGENKYKDKGIRDDKEIDFEGWQASSKHANTKGRGKALFEQAARLTRKSTPSNTHIRYLAESAIHYYTRARQVHAEGKTYQEMIRSLYFLDDDLNNDTLQFYLAIERYSLNKGKIKDKEYSLKKRCRKSDVYKTEWYFSRTGPFYEDTFARR